MDPQGDSGEFFKAFQQFTEANARAGTGRVHLTFNPDEFHRQPDAQTEASDEDVKRVLEALVTSLTSGMMSFASEMSSIAAQLKNSLGLRDMDAAVLERSMTKIVDDRLWESRVSGRDISYSDDGGGIYGAGVRVFKIRKQE